MSRFISLIVHLQPSLLYTTRTQWRH